MRKTYQLAVWEISRMPAEPNLPSPPSPWPLYLGKYTPLDARWPEACLLAKQPWLRSGIFSDAARKMTVRRPWVGVHSPRVFFTIPASLLASHYIPARLTGRNAQMPFVYSSVGLRTHMQIYPHGHTNTRTLQTIFSQTNWLLHTFMISTPPPPRFNFHVDETEFTV